jgi:arginine:ornithine antiporter / lysine permease
MKQERKLGVLALTALVVGAMIGGGAFDLPMNMASGASAGAVLIGWVITGIGMVALALSFQNLSLRKPELDSGIYSYARAGFGEFIGFNSAWGYWLSAWFGNIAYATLLFSALSYFFPVFGQGNNLASIVGASILLWAIQALVLRGVKEASLVNAVVTVAKLVPLIVFTVAVVIAFHLHQFVQGFWGLGQGFSWGAVAEQVRSTMLVTLWVFIGVEGAVVLSARARERRDIGRATVLGLLGTMLIYVLISVLPYGVMSQSQLGSLKTPSTAYVLAQIVGPWGAGLINFGLVVSLLGAWLGWTLLAAEIPLAAAKDGVFPQQFRRENSNGSPSVSLVVTSGLIQLFLVLVLFSQSTYQALYSMASAAILVPYLFSALYQLKLAWTGEAYAPDESRGRDLVIGIVATLYAFWMVYAAGWSYLLTTAVLYAPGILVYWWSRRQAEQRAFRPFESVLAVLLVVAAAMAITLMATGKLSI